MPGYSGTPLPKKLGIKPGLRVFIVDIPSDVRDEIKLILAGCKISYDRIRPLDFIWLFPKSRDRLTEQFQHLSQQLTPAGMIWVSWPKKSSGIATDLTENEIRRIGLTAGLVDVKVCAVTEIWSGLKFVRRVKDRNPDYMTDARKGL